MDAILVVTWAAKVGVYTLVQLAVGVGLFRRLARRGGASADGSRHAEAWLATFARVASGLLITLLLVRLWAQTASVFGAPDARDVEHLRVIAFESRWGNGWRLQLTAAAALLVSAVTLPSRRRTWTLFEAAAVATALTMPLLGHAAGSVTRHVIHSAHTLGAAAWLGTLGVMAIASWRSVTGADVAGAVGRFSPVALTAAGLVTATGIGAAWLYVGSWEALWTSPYGRVLLVKLGAAALVGACGWTNWRTVRRGRTPRAALLTAEWSAAIVVLALTGLLTETEHPSIDRSVQPQLAGSIR